jgi:hypothetical protein
VALAFRIAGAAAGLVIIILAFATSSWNTPWLIALFVAIVIGGAAAYHLLTSVVRCPSCRSGVVNFRIGQAEAKRKIFSCRHCGATAWLTEGFYWQREING